MHEWQLKQGDPLSLTLAADCRLSNPEYVNDHIWELSIGKGEPPALAVQTTYGLRARNLRIFPRFLDKDHVVVDAKEFSTSVVLQHFYPNYLKVSFAPFPDINVCGEFWVPDSHAIAGRFRLTNDSQEPRDLMIDIAVILNPGGEGHRMAEIELGALHVLSGRTNDLAPVLYVKGMTEAGSGPYPARRISLLIPPGESHPIVWALAALPQAAESLNHAQKITQRNWDAEITNLELLNARQVEIHTGDPDWDAALALSQKMAFSLFISPSSQDLNHPSYVATRQPNDGYSLRGDGSDYDHNWSGQTPLDTFYLAHLILPGNTSLARGLLLNAIEAQAADGFIDWKIGLRNQRSQRLAIPLFASLAWHIYQFTEDRTDLVDLFPKLLAFLQAWFHPEHDRDGDGIPEWDHPLQSGFDDHPMFAHWIKWAQGVEIDTVESPDLCAFLYRECLALIHMAELVNRAETIPALKALSENLQAAVQASWNSATNCFAYWDRDTHTTQECILLGSRQGAGEVLIHRSFSQPIRLLFRINTQEEGAHSVQIFIHGTGPSGGHRVERISGSRVHWYSGSGSATSERIYSHIEQVEIQGLETNEEIVIQNVCHSWVDQTLLLPIWAGIPDQERARALVKNTLTNPRMFWRPYGLRACASQPQYEDEMLICQRSYLPYDLLIAKGLLTYGYRARATELITRIMKSIILNLKKENSFYSHYDTETGRGLGECNALSGLAPVGLFLEVLGVRILSPRRVVLEGFNHFPWPVTIKYQGLTILRQKKKSMIIFPDGQNITVKNGKQQLIMLK